MTSRCRRCTQLPTLLRRFVGGKRDIKLLLPAGAIILKGRTIMERLKQHHISFKNAFAGLVWALENQPNFQVHGALSLLAILGGWYFGITRTEYLILIFTIVLGFVAEMINTAIESMTDLITTEWREKAKIAKDVSAGMMLTVAIGATIVALVIFVPYVL